MGHFHPPDPNPLEARGVGVKSLTNGVVDTTTAHGKLVFGMFAVMAGVLCHLDTPGRLPP